MSSPFDDTAADPRKETSGAAVEPAHASGITAPATPSQESQRLLALRLRQGQALQPDNTEPVAPRQRGRTTSCSVSQEALWIVEQLVGGTGAYNIAQAMRISGALDVVALDAALQALLQRHEALRTAFEEHDGVPVQVVQASATAPLSVIDATDLGLPGNDAALQQCLSEQAQRPFDLAQAPLLRASLWHLGKGGGKHEYVLLLVVHHIVADGWSMQVIARELSALYSAFSSGQASPLAALPIQFADWAVWQRERLQDERLAPALHYWRGRLAGLMPMEFPADLPRPSRVSYSGRSEHFTVPNELLERLRALALQQDVTLFMVLLTAFKVLLMRYTGQQDVAVGSPVAGRDRPELEGLIGCFVNSVVLRTDLSGNPSFADALGRVRQTALGAYTHQELSFDKLVADLNPARNLSCNPLYQVSFALNNQPAPVYTLGGLLTRPLPLQAVFSKFDLSLTFVEEEGELRGAIEYSTDLFERSTIQRLSSHVQNLLAGIVADASQRLAELPLLADAERRQMLVDWNATGRQYPIHEAVHTLVERQARRTPDALALVCDGQRLSYRELNAQANQLAHHLRSLGVAPEVLVAVWMQRSLQMVVAMLAVLKAGGALLPLDPELPPYRLNIMLQDTSAPVVLTHSSLASGIPQPADARARTVFCLDTQWQEIAGWPEDNPAGLVGPAHLALVIYTSGSTGQPRGVMLEHGGWSNHVHWMQEQLQAGPGDRFLQITSISFDAAMVELFTPLQAGAALVLATPGGHRDMAYLSQVLQGQAITVVQMVPSALRSLLAEQGFGSGNLRYVICGGEALDHRLANELLQRLPQVTLGNFYGPTETTIDATCFKVPRPLLDSGTGTSVSIGRPIANTRCYVLDDHLQPVPVGVTGELFVGGAGLARGYLNRPELSAERFLADPFVPGQRLYRTGDLARFRADGTLNHLGRNDNQVKVRGFRVELDEIEAVLAEHPEVRRAVVHLWTLAAGDVRLVACCVPAKAGVLAPIKLRKHLRARLPDYMIPQYFLSVEEIPLLPNGKVDRRRLPTPMIAESGIMQYEAPADPVEVSIAGIWTRLVHPTRPIGRHDRFFEMGGHSLLGLQALDQIKQTLGVRLEFRVLFQESLADIATRCRSELAARASGGGNAPNPPALQADAGN